jgi:hypothetical protein
LKQLKRRLFITRRITSFIKNPYQEQPQSEKWFAKRPDWARENWKLYVVL